MELLLKLGRGRHIAVSSPREPVHHRHCPSAESPTHRNSATWRPDNQDRRTVSYTHMPEVLARRPTRHQLAIVHQLPIALDMVLQNVNSRVNEADREVEQGLSAIFLFFRRVRDRLEPPSEGVVQ